MCVCASGGVLLPPIVDGPNRTGAQMYEQEQRIRQLEKCECRLACKWRPAGADALADAPPPPPGPKTDVHSHLGAADAHLEPAGRRAPTTTTQRLNETIQVKMDGQVWRNKCDVCSCHVSTQTPTKWGSTARTLAAK